MSQQVLLNKKNLFLLRNIPPLDLRSISAATALFLCLEVEFPGESDHALCLRIVQPSPSCIAELTINLIGFIQKGLSCIGTQEKVWNRCNLVRLEKRWQLWRNNMIQAQKNRSMERENNKNKLNYDFRIYIYKISKQTKSDEFVQSKHCTMLILFIILQYLPKYNYLLIIIYFIFVVLKYILI